MNGYSPAIGCDRRAILERGLNVIRTEARALGDLADALDDAFVEACRAILGLERQLVISGMGKSGHIARKVAATFAATGTPAVFVHPGEAAHGDMGMLASGDVLLVLSNSGNTPELRAVMAYARRLNIPVIGVASRDGSLVLELADIKLKTPSVREACSVNIAPTASTAVQLALGDALAMTVMDLRGISRSALGALHPGGAIGISFAPVADLMQGPDRLPLVDGAAAMPQAISVMTTGCCGLVGVVDGTGSLVGVITDGDLRRHFEELASACAAKVMTPNPKVLTADMLAGDALAFLNEHKITAAFVVADPIAKPLKPIGIVHIHDLVRHGLG